MVSLRVCAERIDSCRYFGSVAASGTLVAPDRRTPAQGHQEVPVEVAPIQTCCEPVLSSALSAEEAEQLAAAFKLLSDPIRLRLLSLIANAPEGEACACDLTEPIGRSQPTVSHHLSALTAAGLLDREQRGRWAYYRVATDRVEVLRDALALR
jgi:ArsR family transcriptional regulator, arsenate/arsenite/antimonite-responsive transcriptional repressor